MPKEGMFLVSQCFPLLTCDIRIPSDRIYSKTNIIQGLGTERVLGVRDSEEGAMTAVVQWIIGKIASKSIQPRPISRTTCSVCLDSGKSSQSVMDSADALQPKR